MFGLKTKQSTTLTPGSSGTRTNPTPIVSKTSMSKEVREGCAYKWFNPTLLDRSKKNEVQIWKKKNFCPNVFPIHLFSNFKALKPSRFRDIPTAQAAEHLGKSGRNPSRTAGPGCPLERPLHPSRHLLFHPETTDQLNGGRFWEKKNMPIICSYGKNREKYGFHVTLSPKADTAPVRDTRHQPIPAWPVRWPWPISDQPNAIEFSAVF